MKGRREKRREEGRGKGGKGKREKGKEKKREEKRRRALSTGRSPMPRNHPNPDPPKALVEWQRPAASAPLRGLYFPGASTSSRPRLPRAAGAQILKPKA